MHALKEGSAHLHVLVLELDEGPTQLHALLEVVHDALPGSIDGVCVCERGGKES